MERYKISFSQENPDLVTVEDSQTSLHLEFIRGAFHSTQEWFFLCTNAPDASEAARATQEMGEWLVRNHPDLVADDEGYIDDEEDEETAMIEDIFDSFDDDYISLNIEEARTLKHDATLYILDIDYPDEKMRIPVIHYEGQNWVFTPWDWQSLPTDLTDIEAIDWRLNNTEEEGIMFDGLPMLAPWVGEIKDPTEERRAHRKRLGRALKEARKECGYSVLEVEKRTGVSRTIISRTEAGRANTTIDTINTLADCYGYRLELMKEVPYFNSEEAFAEFLKKQREQGKK